jgi:alpha-beta hydrolase superfamily lysophospholipase
MNLKTDRGTLARARTAGPALYFTRVTGEKTQAVVGILHGYADYGARYEHVQRAWAERGIASVTIDMRGHGHAEGPRGACRKFDEYLDDVQELFALLGDESPRFLFGHSFGGLVAATRALKEPKQQKGLLLSNPYFKLALSPPRAKVIAGRIASAVLPFIGVPSGLRGEDLTHDDAIVKAYNEDPLVFKNANARWFTETEAAQERALAGASALELPLYVVLGTADPMVRGGREFFDAAPSTDKTLDVRQGLLHEVLNEPEWPAIAGAMADWMLARA